jgi:hypothetical protein
MGFSSAIRTTNRWISTSTPRRLEGRLRTSTSGRSADDATAEAYLASRSWRSHATPDGPPGRLAPQAAADRHRSNASAAHPAAVAGGGSLRTDRRAPPALGALASVSGPSTASGGPMCRSRARGYVTAGVIGVHRRSGRVVGHNETPERFRHDPTDPTQNDVPAAENSAVFD